MPVGWFDLSDEALTVFCHRAIRASRPSQRLIE
jgi:hypothetical protein